MDSVTQAALGAAIGVAVMGRTRPIWQSALAGALVGTLPDLDVFIDKGDPVRDMVLHRAETHAFFWQALAAPLIAALLAWFTGSRALWPRWLLMVLLGLFTHSLLDAMTIYGTRLHLPFDDRPFGLGSLFIIDPLYTLPLLVGIVAAAIVGTDRGRRWNLAGLLVSSLYAGWSVAAQAHVTGLAIAAAEAQDLTTDQILVTPSPFNTLLWRIVLLSDDHYHEGFRSLLDKDPGIEFQRRPRDVSLDRLTAHIDSARLIREFSNGFYTLLDDGERIQIVDLRMGQSPYFAFRFVIAEHGSKPLRVIPVQQLEREMPVPEGLDWLWHRLLGNRLPPPA